MADTTLTQSADEQYVDPLRVALDEIRAWRHRQSHTDAPRYAELDTILDAAAVGRIEHHLGRSEPTSLPEAVQGYRAVMDARRRILSDAVRAWDLVEAEAMRDIARFMPGTK
ncbi:hypothetical protein ABT390_36715 [Streptomyces aurantiacus]|uniref:Uncharacterized protein n=1 Tax=Streptomyces aurantiacus JA 4570 TaxID=1286094 RepID=S4AHC1_9ACTN|nr:hypothetical protein [Streptomyces aurantiacus]EPH40877.1 hypothetical protein STRAU_6092 [Streptomyces aurantiacus JA 4570]